MYCKQFQLNFNKIYLLIKINNLNKNKIYNNYIHYMIFKFFFLKYIFSKFRLIIVILYITFMLHIPSYININ